MKLHLIRNIQPGIAIFLSRNDTLKSLNTLQYFILANNVTALRLFLQGFNCATLYLRTVTIWLYFTPGGRIDNV